MELQRARRDIAELCQQFAQQPSRHALYAELTNTEQELRQAEEALLLAADEERARQALLHAADALTR